MNVRALHAGFDRARPPVVKPALKLLIVIPALNEEQSIESIIERVLEARRAIVATSPVSEVAVTVVSDGSTDRTVELATRFCDRINLIVFKQNRGYGAAIKAAWAESDADLLAFLDADGTCDPELFARFCEVLEAEQADVVLGSRLNADSQMPAVRRFGNLLFASTLTLFSSTVVRDTASGMRVVRRSSLPKLFPLPDGLHFTPAMSARAVLSGDVKVVEVPMPYREREGESKLRAGKDGLRFLRAILDAAFLYRPSRPLALMGLVGLAVAAGLMVGPAVYYFQNRSVLEWMIYRFIVSDLLATSGGLFLCAAYLSARIADITLKRRPTGWHHRAVAAFLSSGWFWTVPAALLVTGSALVWPSVVELVRTGATYEHWSRFVAMSVCVEIAVILAVTRLVDYTLGLISAQLAFLQSPEGVRLIESSAAALGAGSAEADLFDRAAEYDAMLDRGIRLSGEDKQFFIRGRIRDLQTQLPVGWTPGRILDFGCGIGDTTVELATAFPQARVVGADTSSYALAHARETHASARIAFHELADLEGIEEFDLCYVNGVFHHIAAEGRLSALSLIRSALAPGGRLALFENNPWNPATRLVMHRIPFDRNAEILSVRQTLRLVRRAGFAHCAPGRFLFYFPRALSALRVVEPWLARLPFGAQYWVLAVK